MSANNHFADTWGSALSAALGQSIQLDDAGGCVLEFEGDIHVVIEPLPDTGLLCLRAALTFPGTHAAPDTLRTALALNHAQLPPGYALALDEHSGQLALLVLLDTTHASPDTLLDFLGGLVEMVPRLRVQLAESAPTLHDRRSAFADFRA